MHIKLRVNVCNMLHTYGAKIIRLRCLYLGTGKSKSISNVCGEQNKPLLLRVRFKPTLK